MTRHNYDFLPDETDTELHRRSAGLDREAMDEAYAAFADKWWRGQTKIRQTLEAAIATYLHALGHLAGIEKNLQDAETADLGDDDDFNDWLEDDDERP